MEKKWGLQVRKVCQQEMPETSHLGQTLRRQIADNKLFGALYSRYCDDDRQRKGYRDWEGSKRSKIWKTPGPQHHQHGAPTSMMKKAPAQTSAIERGAGSGAFLKGLAVMAAAPHSCRCFIAVIGTVASEEPKLQQCDEWMS